MKKYLNAYSAFRVSPGVRSVKIADLNERCVVEALGEFSDADNATWEKVVYQTEAGGKIGWMYTGALSAYEEKYPRNCVYIEDQTRDPRDAEQYMTYRGKRQVNMCGELCASFVLRVSLGELLAKWEKEKNNYFIRVLGGGVFRGTGSAELQSMFAAFNLKSFLLETELRDPFLKRARYTPGGIARLLEDRAVIASVHIDGVTGRLRGGGVLHWVVLTAAHDERCGYGLVELYNPFCNRVEVYSWNEFILSAGKPYGVTI